MYTNIEVCCAVKFTAGRLFYFNQTVKTDEKIGANKFSDKAYIGIERLYKAEKKKTDSGL